MTGDVRYFRVTTSSSGYQQDDCSVLQRPIGEASAIEDDESLQQASYFLKLLRAQRTEHEAIAMAAANRNPDPLMDDAGEELWMKKLGISRYLAGLHKDETAASYTSPESGEDAAVSDLRDVSDKILRETWSWCQHGPAQRMTDPPAARISSFWHAANPESKNNTFRRAVGPETLEAYFNHWTELLTFIWNGWRGRSFPQSLAALSTRPRSDQRTRATYSPVQSAGGGEGSAEVSDQTSGQSSDDSSDEDHTQGEISENPYIHYTKRLQACIQRFVRTSVACNRSNDGSADRIYDVLQPSVTVIAMALIQQHLARSSFDSPLLAYEAMLPVDDKFCSWKEPSSFNSHLSALMYCGQLWVFRFCCDIIDDKGRGESEGEEGDDGFDQELDRQMRQYCSNTFSKPLSYLLLWRRRLFGIAPVTMVNRPATWDLARKTVTYQGISVSMDDIRRLLRYTLHHARNLLFHRLMFGIDHIPKLKPTNLQENDNERDMGCETVLVEHVTQTPELRALYLEEETDTNARPRLRWRQSGIRYYRQCVQESLRDMTVLIYFGAGPPVRAPEFPSPMWRNNERLRHVQLRYGKVLIHLVEDKMMAVTGKNVNNVRFLSDDVGELLVNYLVYSMGVLQSMAWQEDITLSVPPFLWVDADGSKWPAKLTGGILKAACRRAGVPEIGTSVWRQKSSAVINTHFGQSDRACFAVAQDAEDASDNIDEEGVDSLVATLVSMSNHSLRTHRQAYANVSPFAKVCDGKVMKSHRASEAWASFFGLGSATEDLTEAQSRVVVGKRSLPDLAGEYEAARKILNTGRGRDKR
ncbi:hypothetical protein LTR95_007407 [Oleoguttula sp. CCFEE 5521]